MSGRECCRSVSSLHRIVSVCKCYRSDSGVMSVSLLQKCEVLLCQCAGVREVLVFTVFIAFSVRHDPSSVRPVPINNVFGQAGGDI